MKKIFVEANNEWIGFWGGYLGAILGGLITLFVMSKTMAIEHLENQLQEKSEECKYIIENISEFSTSVSNLIRQWKKYFQFVMMGNDNIEYYQDALSAATNVEKSGLLVTIYLSSMIDTSYLLYSRELLNEYNEIVALIDKYKKYINERVFNDFEMENFENDINRINNHLQIMTQYAYLFHQKNIIEDVNYDLMKKRKRKLYRVKLNNILYDVEVEKLN